MGLAGFNRSRRQKWNRDKARALAEEEKQKKEDAEHNKENSAQYDRVQELRKMTVPDLRKIIKVFSQENISLPSAPKKVDLIGAIINVEFQPDSDDEDSADIPNEKSNTPDDDSTDETQTGKTPEEIHQQERGSVALDQ